jgi:hypothetical protein
MNPFKNTRDEHGYPVCPVCTRAIRPGQSVARATDYMVHIMCAESRDCREVPLVEH